MSRKEMAKAMPMNQGLPGEPDEDGPTIHIKHGLPIMVPRTSLMRVLEIEHGLPIKELLSGGSLSIISERLGVDASTVSKWKKKFGLDKEAKDVQDC